MTSQRYTIIILSSIVAFTFFNFVAWNSYTYKLFSYKNVTIGDLARLSYIVDITSKRENINTVKKFHSSYSEDLSKIDLITFGDSFSAGGGGGTNMFYQDLIADKYNLNVLDLQIDPRLSWIENVLVLLKLPKFKKIKPKYILLQSVERYSIMRLSQKVNWDISPDNRSTEFILAPRKKEIIPSFNFLHIANLKAPIFKILYRFDDNAIFSKVYITRLVSDFFTSKRENDLVFYFEDLQNLRYNRVDWISALNDNLNQLSKKLREQEIELIFMPVVNKYTLYQDFIQSSDYPKSNFFELLRKLDKEYNFVDTKRILSEALHRQEKDIYYSDDSHWGAKAREKIINAIRQDIKP